ncbi:hypothetical protein HDV01_000217 [Terramyces sp. JEL0728]|nr:hypothetical protein HDV01_000217 [Terramyces sp. JEL0728]
MDDHKDSAVEFFDESYWTTFLSGTQDILFWGENLDPVSDKSHIKMTPYQISEFDRAVQDPSMNESHLDTHDHSVDSNQSVQNTMTWHHDYPRLSLGEQTLNLHYDNQADIKEEFDASQLFSDSWTCSGSEITVGTQVDRTAYQQELNEAGILERKLSFEFGYPLLSFVGGNSTPPNYSDDFSFNLPHNMNEGSIGLPGSSLLHGGLASEQICYTGSSSIQKLSHYVQASFSLKQYSLWLLYPSVAQKSYRQERRLSNLM